MPDLKKSLLITLDFPPQFGGVAAYYQNICLNLPPDKITVLAPEINDAEKFDQSQPLTVIRSRNLAQIAEAKGGLFNLGNKLKWLALAGEIKQLAKHHGFEILLVGQILPLGHVALLLKKHLPYIVFTHGMDITVPAKNNVKKSVLKKIIRHSKAMVANSYFTRHELSMLGADKDKVCIVNPCPNLKAEHILPEQIESFLRRHELSDKKIILTVGRLVKRKGHDQVIKALPLILKKIPSACYLIAGGGPDKNHLVKLVSELKLGKEVKFIENISQDDLPIIYQACEVMAMPSRRLENGDVEGFGTVYLEANLFGKPVIAGRSGGVPEAVLHEKTGLLVDPLDTEQIAEAAISLLIDPAYAHRLGLQGMERVHDEFNWPDQIIKLKTIL